MEHLIKVLDNEMERMQKVVDQLGQEHRFTKEKKNYIAGLMAGMLLSFGINEKIYNQYGKQLEKIAGE